MSNKKLHTRSGLYITNTGEAYHEDGTQLTPTVGKDGHLYVGETCLHMAVARCHLQNEMFSVYVAFKDGNKLNVSAENLEWVSKPQKIKDRTRKINWVYTLYVGDTAEEYSRPGLVAKRIFQLVGNNPLSSNVRASAINGWKCQGFVITRRMLP